MYTNKDSLYNIMLQSDPDQLINLCKTNKLANNICKNKQFWIDKFNTYNFFLPVIYNTDDWNNLRQFDLNYGNMETAKIVMKINDIEKNRTFNKTKGMIRVVIEEMESENLEMLLDKKFESNEYNEIIFTLDNNNNYMIQLQKGDNPPINVGKFSLYDTERILSYCLGITGVCTDEFFDDFLSMEAAIFDEPDISYYLAKKRLVMICVRRGLWEGMYKL